MEGSLVTGKTHLAVGIATGTFVAGVTGVSDKLIPTVTTIAVAGFASLLPDIDEDGSMLNEWLFRFVPKSFQLRSILLALLGAVVLFLSYCYHGPVWAWACGIWAMVVAFVPHRTITHSVVGTAFLAWVMKQAWPEYALAAVAGYGSHLLTDAMTPKGIPLFWPWKLKVGFKALGIRVKTGGGLDKVLGIIALWCACLLMVWFVFSFFYQEAVAAGLFSLSQPGELRCR
jgi:inner membrane protein